MSDKPKLKGYGVTETSQVFTSEENANTFSEFLKVQHLRYGAGNIEKKYRVYEIFPDCFIGKIKKGYKTFIVNMKRDGKLLRCTPLSFLPNRFGFNRGRIIPSLYRKVSYTGKSLPPDPNDKMIEYYCLAEDEKGAISLCDAYRIKTLIDDTWFKDLEEF